eukprot:5256056-Pyramimonas_sp.AAC.1
MGILAQHYTVVDGSILGNTVRQRRFGGGCGWVSDVYRRERSMIIQMLEYADMLGPVGLDHLVALESTRAQHGLPCPHRPALQDGE